MTKEVSLSTGGFNSGSEVKEGYWTVRQTAKFLNCSEKTVRKLISNRQIPFIKIGGMIRIPSDEIVNSASYYPSLSVKQRMGWK